MEAVHLELKAITPMSVVAKGNWQWNKHLAQLWRQRNLTMTETSDQINGPQNRILFINHHYDNGNCYNSTTGLLFCSVTETVMRVQWQCLPNTPLTILTNLNSKVTLRRNGPKMNNLERCSSHPGVNCTPPHLSFLSTSSLFHLMKQKSHKK